MNKHILLLGGFVIMRFNMSKYEKIIRTDIHIYQSRSYARFEFFQEKRSTLYSPSFVANGVFDSNLVQYSSIIELNSDCVSN